MDSVPVTPLLTTCAVRPTKIQGHQYAQQPAQHGPTYDFFQKVITAIDRQEFQHFSPSNFRRDMPERESSATRTKSRANQRVAIHELISSKHPHSPVVHVPLAATIVPSKDRRNVCGCCWFEVQFPRLNSGCKMERVMSQQIYMQLCEAGAFLLTVCKMERAMSQQISMRPCEAGAFLLNLSKIHRPTNL